VGFEVRLCPFSCEPLVRHACWQHCCSCGECIHDGDWHCRRYDECLYSVTLLSDRYGAVNKLYTMMKERKRARWGCEGESAD